MRVLPGLVIGALLVGCDGSAPSNSGAPGADGSWGVACGGGTISFKLSVAAGDSTQYSLDYGGFYCPAPFYSLSQSWMSIRPAGVEPGSYDPHLNLPPVSSTYGTAMTSCERCQPNASTALCFGARTIGSDGVEDQFDGRYAMPNRCGEDLPCYEFECAPAGDYVARLCAYARLPQIPNHSDEYRPMPTCVDVPFTWPPVTSGLVIERTIGGVDTDAGDASAN